MNPSNITVKREEEFHAKGGPHVLTLADGSSQEARRFQRRIVFLRDRMAASRPSERPRYDRDNLEMRGLIRKINSRYAIKRWEVMNVLPTVGRSALIGRLANDTTYTGIANKCALGSSSTPAANGDTKLGAETYRNNIASLAYANNIAYLTGFFTGPECSGTYNEAGLFIDGAAGADTGVLLSHTLTGVTKSGIQTFTIDFTITLS